MTDAAILSCLDMIHRILFARGKHAIMTGLTVIHDTRMIKGRRQEAGGLVTVDAVIVCRYMVCRFTGGCITVMARCTVTGYARVIKGRTCKRRGVVTVTTILTGIKRNMW